MGFDTKDLSEYTQRKLENVLGKKAGVEVGALLSGHTPDVAKEVAGTGSGGPPASDPGLGAAGEELPEEPSDEE